MNLQIASDLHLEFASNYEKIVGQNALKAVGDVLLMAGDTSYHSDPNPLDDFLDQYADLYDKIISIGGNHEWYNSVWNTDVTPKDNKRLVYLDDSVFQYDGVRFLGTTLWSGASLESSEYLNDYRAIVGFNVKAENKAYHEARSFLVRELEQPFDGKTVVVSHHMPLLECIDPPYRDSPCNDCFASDQSAFMENYEIDLWVHGHSHSFQDLTVHDTRVVRNPLGYRNEWGDWKPDFTIHL